MTTVAVAAATEVVAPAAPQPPSPALAVTPNVTAFRLSLAQKREAERRRRAARESSRALEQQQVRAGGRVCVVVHPRAPV